jgi:hypothetical protein
MKIGASMRPLAACHISEGQQDTWIRSFLSRHEPFFFQGERLVNRLLDAGMIVYTRPEFRESFPHFFLDYGCIYQLGDVPQETYVWMADAKERLHIDADLLQDILMDQVRLHRGQVYDHAWRLRLQNAGVMDDLSEQTWQRLFQHHQVHDGSSHVVLTHDIWTTLPRSVQATWLLEWLNDQLVDDEAVPINPSEIPVPDSYRPLVMKYSGCFADASGANCFSATLAMAMGTLAKAEHIIHLWLHQEPFLRSLLSQGYQVIQEFHQGDKISAIEPLDVLVWSNGDGHMVHASFCVAPGYVFNKMGQNWQQPWLVLRLEDVLNYNEVVSTGGKLVVYRKR